jgi:ribosome-associated protein
MAVISADTLRVQVSDRKAVELPLGEIELRFSRSSGPGGQHMQKTETRVEAVFDVEASSVLSDADKRRLLDRIGPVVRAVAQDERSQWRNRELALERLTETLAAGLKRQRRRRPTSPSQEARKRRLAAKRRRAATKRLRGDPSREEQEE